MTNDEKNIPAELPDEALIAVSGGYVQQFADGTYLFHHGDKLIIRSTKYVVTQNYYNAKADDLIRVEASSDTQLTPSYLSFTASELFEKWKTGGKGTSTLVLPENQS